VKIHTWTSSHWSGHYGGPKAKRDVHTILHRLSDEFHSHDAVNGWEVRPSAMDHKLAVVQHPTAALTSPGKVECADHFDAFLRYWTATWEQRVVVLHDLKALQAEAFSTGHSALPLDEWWRREDALLSSATTVIVHSEPMAKVVRCRFSGVSAKIVPLGLFDYLCTPDVEADRLCEEGRVRIAYCGNVAGSSIIEELLTALPRAHAHSYIMYLANATPAEQKARDDIAVHLGCDADGLPSRIAHEADFGLCWWAKDVADSGYLSLIAPHKASCYLAAGLPILAPEDSYIGEFAENMGVGLAVRSLSSIPDAVGTLSRAQFEAMKARCRQLSLKVSSGEYTTAALVAAESRPS
jgi:hypothetical protein